MRRPRGEPAAPDAGECLAAVVAAVHAGATPRAAWEEWPGATVDADGHPQTLPGADAQVTAALRAASCLVVRTGAPAAPVWEAIARVQRDRDELAVRLEAALAGPRASARMLRLLPLAGLGLATLVDTSVLRFMVATPGGWVLLGLAALLWWAGQRWSEALVARAAASVTEDGGDGDGGSASEGGGRVGDGGVPPLPLSAVIALCAGAIAAGLDVRGAVQATGRAVGGGDGQVLDAVVAQLDAGRSWEDAWRTSGRLAVLGRALAGSWRRGSPPQAALDAAREGAHRRTTVRMERASAQVGAMLTLPLTLCLLPAFVLVSIVPLVVVLAAGVLAA